MGSYYYLAAQLPYLVYGQPAPMSSGAFLALAKSLMDKADASALDYCVLDPADEPHSPLPTPHSPFLAQWYEWEGALRKNLAKSRAQNLKREGAFDAADDPADAAGAAKAACALDSPLEAETLLDKARWNAIENMAGLSAFSENAMYAYLLKLRLLERQGAFKPEEGFSRYKELYASILAAAEKPAGWTGETIGEGE